jgi:hypothetical protein
VTDWLRRAGTGRLETGGLATWSLAEGRRGRRWRWTIVVEGALHQVSLVEIDPGGHVTRLELATAAGLLTLHPDETGRRLHGNVANRDGVRGVDRNWSDGHRLALIDDEFGSAVLGASDAGARTIVAVGADLVLRAVRDRSDLRIATHRAGIPRLIESREWPLEE